MSIEGKTYIVGIGASAGGLEAVTKLIANLSPTLPCAYVLLQHLSPTYKSMMVDILSRETVLSVIEATDGLQLKAGMLCVIPASYNAILEKGVIRLSLAPPESSPKPSINQFFCSLAEEEATAATGILLSGTGSDGVAGLRAIQTAGGHTLVQLPETAKYEGMPQSAIDAGVADHIASPEDLPAALQMILSLETADTLPPEQDLLGQLLSKLKSQIHYDFTGYKIGTLMRRIRRREIATGNFDLNTYLNWVDQHPEELDLLAKDILISVTAFFRDHDAFDALRDAINLLCQSRKDGGDIRVWVAGCASGEEVYSIAMLIAESLYQLGIAPPVQIFATDVDDDALNIARRGIYPQIAMNIVPMEMREKYFNAVGSNYEAKKSLRDMIVFAKHNLVTDPPFFRLDLVSCRNVLIYFDAVLQAKVLKTFQFGLKKEGLLFLGRSESIGQSDNCFSPINRRERLYKKTGDNPTELIFNPSESKVEIPMVRKDRRMEMLLTGIVQQLGVTCVLCDRDGAIQHAAGQVDKFLKFPEGATRCIASEVILPALRGELLSMMHRARQENQAQHGRQRKLESEWVYLLVSPLHDAGTQYTLVLIIPVEAVLPDEMRPVSQTLEMEDELLVTREHLQTLVEEMATSNEEMQTLNEEAQAANEELQATNEELEAANQELQATNEELISLNEELNVKTYELGILTEEYVHLYDALHFPIMVFDQHAELIRFNKSAAKACDLRTTALNQNVHSLRLPSKLAELPAKLYQVIEHGEIIEEIISDLEQVQRLVITPGFDSDGHIRTLVTCLIDITDVAKTQSQLMASQNRLLALMEKTTVIFAMKDLHGHYQYANSRFLMFFGLSADEYQGKSNFSLMSADIATSLWELDLRALRTGESCSGEHMIPGKDGPRYLKTVHQILHDINGEPSAFIIEAEDITLSKQAAEQLRINAQVFEQAGEAIVVTDSNAIIQTVNTAFQRITGYGSEAIGQPLQFLKSEKHSEVFYQQLWASLKEKGFWQGEIWNKHRSGEEYPCWLTINLLDDNHGNTEHFIAIFSDIAEIKTSQQKAEYLSTHDALTGLPNRALFNDRLKHDLATASRNKQQLALLFIDLDDFKTINDTLGHDVGDELLREAANRLRAVVRDVDTVARLGGDEFTAILSDCTPTSVSEVANRILNDLSASFIVQGRTLFVSASIGVAFYPDDHQDATSLVRSADAAMYRAKELGRNRVEFYRADLQVRLMKRAILEGALREAMRKNRLRLVFQPKYAIAHQPLLIGAEALLRWQDPELGNVPPAEFIPVAEASGLVIELTQTVEMLLINQLIAWQAQGFVIPPIAFNVSARSIREPMFASKLIDKIMNANISTQLIQVEITEGALLENSQVVTSNLDELNCAGVNIAIDDFGTGYSSLSYLKRLPLHELKIDKSFVDGLGKDPEDEAIAKAVLGLAKALDLHTIAEGVESDEQLNWLVQHDCDSVQGYLLSRPLESSAFEALLRAEGATA
ncbi:EAL domain-containing protein [Leeia sp. TBRC 13508]|uniref:EAL domain-containing protein n=1 Tax=Leeia speluncae TaxID=2884804 RepID=A0ABS8D8Q5_9NEIS|nr:EAL domain-containing protein [Leeia speluncae]MCB6184566.1 EAL domain-containing protein [Leeia speluncae]